MAELYPLIVAAQDAVGQDRARGDKLKGGLWLASIGNACES
jgi:hypothetical protein